MSGTYAELAALAERQVALAREERWEELGAMQATWVELVAGLPAVPPPEAAHELERAARAWAESGAALEAARHDLAAEVARLERGRQGVRAYAPERVDPTVDRSG